MRYAPHLRRATLARRIAAGLPVWAAARGADMPVEEAEALMREPDFRELIDSWGRILALDPEARKQRLLGLANDIIDDALGRGDMRTILFVQRQRQRSQARRPAPARCRRGSAPVVKAVVKAATVSPPEPCVASAPARMAPAAPDIALDIAPDIAIVADRSTPQRPVGGATPRPAAAARPITEDRPAANTETTPVSPPAHPRPAPLHLNTDSRSTDHATVRENLAAALRRKHLREARRGGRWPGGP
jgi:hypothetical protein